MINGNDPLDTGCKLKVHKTMGDKLVITWS